MRKTFSGGSPRGRKAVAQSKPVRGIWDWLFGGWDDTGGRG